MDKIAACRLIMKPLGWIKTVIETQTIMKMNIMDRKANLKIIEKNIRNKFKWDWLQEKDEHGFLAHLWGAYAIPLALSLICRQSSVLCLLCPP